jgi:general secretion pathway protein K
MVGQLLKALAIEPVAFKLASDAAKMVTAESKMFSIYADGIVPGYRRKTTVRIHSVIDFRGAPAPGAPLGGQATAGAVGAGGTATAGRPAAGASGAGGAGGAGSGQDLSAVMAPNPGGTVVYYRME